MTFSFQNIFKSQQSSAEVVDGYLILSLLDAIEPVVWRMSLEKIGAAAFEIKSEESGTLSKLILKPKKGTAEIIASFSEKEGAVQALKKASMALQNKAQASFTPVPTPDGGADKNNKTVKIAASTQHIPKKEGQRWWLVIVGIILVGGLYYYLNTLIPNTTTNFQGAQNIAAPNNNASPSNTTGVPVSADDFLNGL